MVSVGHPLAGVAVGLPQRQLSWYVLWFLFPGVAERVLPADNWALYRRWIWAGAQPGQDPDLDRQLADLCRPGALEAGLWYRANNDPAQFPISDPAQFQMPRSPAPPLASGPATTPPCPKPR